MYFHSDSQHCCYFHRVTTHSENWVFIGAPFALIIVTNVQLFSQDCYTICKLTFLLRRVGWCQLNKTGILSSGLQRILKTESSPMRLLLLPSSGSCGYFLRIATQFASLRFNCRKVATHVLVESLLGRLGCCRSDEASNYSWRATIASASWLFIGSP